MRKKLRKILELDAFLQSNEIKMVKNGKNLTNKFLINGLIKIWICISTFSKVLNQAWKKPWIKKKQPTCFLGFIFRFGFIVFFYLIAYYTLFNDKSEAVRLLNQVTVDVT